MANVIKVIESIIKVEESAADFILNGPSDGIGGYVRDGYRTRCEQFTNLPAWARALSTGPAGSLGRICKPYLDTIPADLPEKAPPPFTGGQCPGKPYRYQYAVRQANGTQGPFTVIQCSANRFGPISSRSQTVGQITTLFITSSDASGVATEAAVASSNSEISLTLQIISTCNGTADDCGDPDSPGLETGPNPAPNPGPLPGPEPTDNPNSPIPFLPIPPYNDPIGGPTPIEPPPDEPLPVAPQPIPGNPDSGEGGPENVGDSIEVDPGPGGGGDDTLFGPPPDGRVWVGALLQFQIPSAYGIIPGSAPANPVTARVFANASLVFANGRGTPVRVNGGNIDLFRANGAMQVLGVYVNCLPGITYNVRPVSVEKCPENECSVE